MNKRIIIILVEAITVFLFLIALNFFYNAKMANLAAADYQSQLDKMGQLLSKSLDAAKKTKVQNGQLIYELDELKNSAAQLSGQNNSLREQNVQMALEIKSLRQELDKFKINSEAIVPLKEKIKGIVALMDRLNPGGQSESELDRILRAIYEQLNSVDFSMAKLAKDEPLYREMIKEKELKLQQAVNKAEEASSAGRHLAQELAARDDKIKSLQKEIDALAGYKESSSEAAEKISALTQARDNLARDLKEANKEMARLNKKMKPLLKVEDDFTREKNKLAAAMGELKGELSSKDKHIKTLQDRLDKLEGDRNEADLRYSNLEKTVQGYQESLANRAARIVSLEENLEGRQITFDELNFKLKKQLRELAEIREDMVKLKLDNANLRRGLEKKEAAFAVLKANMAKMQSANQEFRNSIDNASRVFSVKAASGQGKVSQKEVKVEINSVDSQTVARQEKGEADE